MPARAKARGVAAPKPKAGVLRGGLSPMVELKKMVEDMIARNQDGLQLAFEKLAFKPLRLATMCSGTEAPLLMVGQITEGKCPTLNHFEFS